MNLTEALSIINTFWKGNLPLPGGVGEQRLIELESEFGMTFPPELQEYIRDFVPLESIKFETVGNPMELYGAQKLGAKQYGYTYNPVTNESIPDWPINWFLFADEGADPVIFDLSDSPHSVQRSAHGMGEWNFSVEADSIGQFLLCCAAIHHALTFWGHDVILDDENGFNLAVAPSSWLFPRMKEWAGNYYEDRCSVFDNH